MITTGHYSGRGADRPVNATKKHSFWRMALQPDGRVVIGGDFTHIGGVGRNRIARIGHTDALRVQAKALLQGPYAEPLQWMGANLRDQGLLPNREPYSGMPIFSLPAGAGGERITPLAMSLEAYWAIVDWVVLELRDPVAPHAVIHSRCALVNRVGGIMDLDGQSPVTFTGAAGMCRIAVRHRNHLGIMSEQAYFVGGGVVEVDFTDPATATCGTQAQKQVTDKMVMWAGDVNGDGQLKYTGSANDRDPILVAVGGTTPTNTLSGYYRNEDVSMNGTVQYTGALNDRDLILVNIGGTTPTNVRMAQLP